ELEVEVDVKINVNAEGRSLASERVVLEEQVPEIRNFLDLNLPAAASIDEERGNGSSHSEIYKSWWLVGGSSLNQDAMAVGLLSN
ncbi:C2H2-type zinc finger protein, partial [Trifolium pratense]